MICVATVHLDNMLSSRFSSLVDRKEGYVCELALAMSEDG